jgi:hypothetical protein
MKLYKNKGIQRGAPTQVRMLSPENERYVRSLRKLLGLN